MNEIQFKLKFMIGANWKTKIKQIVLQINLTLMMLTDFH